MPKRTQHIKTTFALVSLTALIGQHAQAHSGANPNLPLPTSIAQLKMEQPESAPEEKALHQEKPAADNGAFHNEVPAFAPGAPLALPGSEEPEGPPAAFKLSTTTQRNLNAEDLAKVNRLKKAPNKVVQNAALKAFSNGNYKLAQELYEMLTQRDPKNPGYFYGAGDAYAYEGDNPSAFANFVTAWHLGDSSGPQYVDAANEVVDKMKKEVDDTFKLTYNYGSQDDETILNAATRMWKSGFTKQAVQLNEYALKNQPIYAQIAAYNLGAIAEHNGDYKQALQYYQWAAKRSKLLEAHASADVKIAKSLSELPPAYIEQAVNDMQESLKGNAISWRGWAQADSYPKHWASEVCPLCAISRTQTDYLPGQMTLEH